MYDDIEQAVKVLIDASWQFARDVRCVSELYDAAETVKALFGRCRHQGIEPLEVAKVCRNGVTRRLIAAAENLGQNTQPSSSWPRLPVEARYHYSQQCPFGRPVARVWSDAGKVTFRIASFPPGNDSPAWRCPDCDEELLKAVCGPGEESIDEGAIVPCIVCNRVWGLTYALDLRRPTAAEIMDVELNMGDLLTENIATLGESGAAT